jgi:hypothetical protein
MAGDRAAEWRRRAVLECDRELERGGLAANEKENEEMQRGNRGADCHARRQALSRPKRNWHLKRPQKSENHSESQAADDFDCTSFLREAGHCALKKADANSRPSSALCVRSKQRHLTDL